MKIPALPVHEKERLAALYSLNILDTRPEERFDRLTRMACRMFQAPIALVSLVDDRRQWFKSKVGLDVDEIFRDFSFCAHAILGNEIFVIEDALQDERFHDNPLVSGDPNIRFYLGTALRFQDRKIGTLSVIDQKPRSLSDEDLTAFRDLAVMAQDELTLDQLTTIDELTKISNRRGFISLAQNSISLCIRQGAPVSMVCFDFDEITSINQEFGNSEGDHALNIFAGLMCKTFRESDVFARIGGDEFAVLLTNAGEEFASGIVDRFRDLVNAYNRDANRGYNISFTDSIVSLDSQQESTVDDLLLEADVLMYEKKFKREIAEVGALKHA